MKIRHGANVDSIVVNLFAKFDDDRLWNEKALGDRKPDNNNLKKKNNNNVRGHWGAVSGIDDKNIDFRIKKTLKNMFFSL